jgi:S1-C subfamily serine protease
MPGRYYILSNNHVLANSNNASIGDHILQPGPYDGGLMPSDVIALLSAFVPIQWITPAGAPCNYVDAAIAWGQFHDLNREIYWIGYVKGLSVAEIGDIVRKTGRTSNFTTGRVLAVNATVDVNYGGGRKARFCRQIITTAMARGGDSGSLVCDLEERAVGLLFAGSSTITVVNHIHYVVNLLGIRIAE